MLAIVLAGGAGKRLEPLTLKRPKALLPLLTKPMISYILDRIPEEVERVVIAGRKKIEMFNDFIKNAHYEFEVIVSEEPEPLGTAGALKFCEKHNPGESEFLVFNGDVISSLDLKEFIKFHRSRGCFGTVALYRVKDPSRYGRVDLNPDNYITKFEEKPGKAKTESASSEKKKEKKKSGDDDIYLINAGIYIFSTELFNYIPEGQKVSMEREVFPALLDSGISGYPFDGAWIDAGTGRDYIKAHRIVLENLGRFGLSTAVPAIDKVRAQYKGTEIEGPIFIDADVKIGKSVVLGPNVCIGKNVKIGDGCRIANSVIMKNTSIGNGTEIENAIVGYSSKIGNKCKLTNYYIAGDKSEIADGENLG